MISRSLNSVIQKRISSKKPVILFGPAGSGKASLLTEIARSIDPLFQSYDCTDPKTLNFFQNGDYPELKEIIGGKKAVFLNNVSRINNLSGFTLRMTGFFPETRFLMAGSYFPGSTFGEGYIGLSTVPELFLHPICWQEYSEYETLIGSKSELEARIIYGMYPEIIENPGNEKEILSKLTEEYIFREINFSSGIRKPQLLKRLLQILALNIGKEISLNQLSELVKVDKNTIGSYIAMLEKAFIVFSLMPLKRNHPHEVKSSRKIFFYDNGIRNGIISNYAAMNLRLDAGSLWENFCISERHKFLYLREKQYNSYYWRTTSKKEVDYIEEYDQGLHAYRFKWNLQTKRIFSKTFRNAYPLASTDIISTNSFGKFVSSSKIKI